jgi:hypothetical protein
MEAMLYVAASYSLRSSRSMHCSNDIFKIKRLCSLQRRRMDLVHVKRRVGVPRSANGRRGLGRIPRKL